MVDLAPLARDIGYSPEDMVHILDNLDSFSPEELAEIDSIVGELSSRAGNKAAYDDLIEFCKLMMPEFIVGRHHRILADLLMAIEAGDEDRVCVNIPPRHGKSQLVSIFFPAWFLGRNPNKKVMMVSHTTNLCSRGSCSRWTVSLRGGGTPARVGNTLRVVSVLPLRVVVLTCFLLTTHTQSRMLLTGTFLYSRKPMSGLHSVRVLD